MEQPRAVKGNFALSFSLKFQSIFGSISHSTDPVTMIWVSLESSFPPAELECKRCQFWSKVMDNVRSGTNASNHHRQLWVAQVSMGLHNYVCYR